MTKSPHEEYAGLREKNGNGTHLVVYKEEDDDEGIYLQESQWEYSQYLEKGYGNWLNVKSNVIVVMVAFPLLLVAITLGWIAIPCFIRQQISNKVVIFQEATPELYSACVHPPIPVCLKIYLFNVTNPDGVVKGALPKLVELFEGIKGYRFTAPQSVLEEPRKGGESHWSIRGGGWNISQARFWNGLYRGSAYFPRYLSRPERAHGEFC